MWTKLLTFFYPKTPAYWTSDQVFINEWEAAIDMCGQIFSGLTLVVTTGSGLPHLSTTGFTVPKGFSADCPPFKWIALRRQRFCLTSRDPPWPGLTPRQPRRTG